MKELRLFPFDVFTAEGIYLRQVRVPQNLMLVRGDMGYGIARAEDEFLVVKRLPPQIELNWGMGIVSPI